MTAQLLLRLVRQLTTFATVSAWFVFLTSTSHAVTFEWAPIGNAGNAPDPNFGGIFGDVAETFRISKLEVNNRQYTDFLNAVDPVGSNTLGLYDIQMNTESRGGISLMAANPSGSKYTVKAGRDANPVVFVNWYDSVRFANWFANGQGGPGTTETGSYTLLGGTPVPTNATSITRNPGALFFLPHEDEWYKAAYHHPAADGGDADNYWLYPMQTNSTPDSAMPPGAAAPDPSITANFLRFDGVMDGVNDGYAVTGMPGFPAGNALSDVGAYLDAESFYETFDQGGNVKEWTETDALGDGTRRVNRGGGWGNNFSALSAASRDFSVLPDNATRSLGFRLAGLPSDGPIDPPSAIPEPATALLLVLGGLMLTIGFRGRRMK